jgi:hypothetical protein
VLLVDSGQVPNITYQKLVERTEELHRAELRLKGIQEERLRERQEFQRQIRALKEQLETDMVKKKTMDLTTHVANPEDELLQELPNLVGELERAQKNLHELRQVLNGKSHDPFSSRLLTLLLHSYRDSRAVPRRSSQTRRFNVCLGSRQFVAGVSSNALVFGPIAQTRRL